MRRTARFIGFVIAGLTFWAVIVADIIYSPRNFDLIGAAILALVLAWIIGDETWKALRKAWRWLVLRWLMRWSE
jgi:hypothetical protein